MKNGPKNRKNKSGQIVEKKNGSDRPETAVEKLKLHVLGEAQSRRRRMCITCHHADVLSRRCLHHYAPLSEHVFLGIFPDFSGIKNFLVIFYSIYLNINSLFSGLKNFTMWSPCVYLQYGIFFQNFLILCDDFKNFSFY